MLITKLVKTALSGGVKGHFGQWAEDVLVRKLFPRKKTSGIYLDIGAYHPFKHSNTAYFWLKGWHGFNIDANPNTINLFNKARPTDTNIWTAIIPEKDYRAGIREVDLMLPAKKDHASGVSATGTCHSNTALERDFKESQKVSAKSISQIITDFNISNIDYLNVDVEGYDSVIIQEFDFAVFHPKVISIEDYSEDMAKLLSSEISTFLFSKGYLLMGRAGPTSIFYLP